VIGDFRTGGDSIDLLLVRDPSYELTPEALRAVPFAARDDRSGDMAIVPLSQVADFVRTDAPQQINRIEQRRAVTFNVTSPPGVPLETTMDELDGLARQVLDQYGGDLEINLAGSADKLTQVRRSLLGNWTGGAVDMLLSLIQSRMFLALLVTFLLMAALFESFLYPAVIMFSVPLATIGGFLGLRLVHMIDPTQQLDVLTMLGFVILIGIVVNNAILIVHQALNFMRGLGESGAEKAEALPPREAIRESVRTRMRPIFMTTATSVMGMLPLVLMPGSGSELYRGLGSVVVGGLILSTIFTLLLVPLLFSVVLEARAAVLAAFGWRPHADPEMPRPAA
jgi:HAE1 family hydrophobic/amphiphilic exporter-1